MHEQHQNHTISVRDPAFIMALAMAAEDRKQLTMKAFVPLHEVARCLHLIADQIEAGHGRITLEDPTPPPPPTTEDDLREALQSFHVYATTTSGRLPITVTVLSHECGWKSSTAMPGPLLTMITKAMDHQAACHA